MESRPRLAIGDVVRLRPPAFTLKKKADSNKNNKNTTGSIYELDGNNGISKNGWGSVQGDGTNGARVAFVSECPAFEVQVKGCEPSLGR